MNAQEQMDEERMLGLLIILEKLDMAMKDGYLNAQDMADIRHEFGFTTQ